MAKKMIGITLFLLLITVTFGCTTSDVQLMTTLITGGASGELTEEEVIQGLTAALKTGAQRAVLNAAEEGGYWSNGSVRIPLPGMIKKAESVLRMAGFGQKVDAFHRSMNRAAEKAAPQALDVFWGVIKDMTFSDAWGILKGDEDAATEYFKSRSYSKLQNLFRPLVRSTMNEVGVTAAYQEIENKIKTLPVQIINEDLETYVTGKALDGLFHLLAREEAKIRKDPAARTSDILRKVFKNS